MQADQPEHPRRVRFQRQVRPREGRAHGGVLVVAGREDVQAVVFVGEVAREVRQGQMWARDNTFGRDPDRQRQVAAQFDELRRGLGLGGDAVRSPPRRSAAPGPRRGSGSTTSANARHHGRRGRRGGCATSPAPSTSTGPAAADGPARPAARCRAAREPVCPQGHCGTARTSRAGRRGSVRRHAEALQQLVQRGGGLYGRRRRVEPAQVDVQLPVRETRSHLMCEPHGQRGLADAAGTGDRDEHG